jgi:hypothetical protein
MRTLFAVFLPPLVLSLLRYLGDYGMIREHSLDSTTLWFVLLILCAIMDMKYILNWSEK